MKSIQFSVVDVETTGGFAQNHRITEVGIVRTNGREILEEFHTLINPEMQIPRHITALTGIDNNTVKEAPTFAEKAQEIVDFLGDDVFVAHNVDFDFSFIKNELQRENIEVKLRKLCTVRYARSLLKDQTKFGLARLAQRFGIVNKHPHRALADARTAALILHKLIAMDGANVLQSKMTKLAREVKLPAHLPPAQYHNLPHAPGVYYFYGADDKPLYIGKAKDLKARITTHFRNAETAKTQAFMRKIVRIETCLTGSELMALIKEDVEIRKYWPPHNRAQKRANFAFHIVQYSSQNGGVNLGVKKALFATGALQTFQSLRAANLWLHEQVKSYQLLPRMCQMPDEWYDFERPSIELHNQRIAQLTSDLAKKQGEFLILEKGRNNKEIAFVHLQNEQVVAIGFAPVCINWQDAMQRSNYAEQVYTSPTLQQVVASHMQTHEDVKILSLKSNK